jgi:MFS family permease
MLVRAVVASTIGTTIEWYDFFLYSTVTGLVFPQLFFPKSDPFVGTLQAFLVYAVGFAARPIGAAIFGHFGDRSGRKAALISTLLLMGIATLLVAIVPTYSVIGIWGAIILTILRFLQGVGVGGEWGGSVLLAMEWAKSNQSRGFIASWPQFGVPVGLFLSNLAVLVCSALAGSNEQFLAWGWRAPFLVSGLLVIIGLWIRLRIMETPTFNRILTEGYVEKSPTTEVIRRQPKSIVLSALIRLAEQTPFYIYTAFVFAYGTTQLKLSKDLFLNAVLVFAVVEFFLIPFAGYISDRIGRKRTYLIGAAVMIVTGFVVFALLDTKNPTLVFIGVVLGAIPHSLVYGPQAALIAEQFTPRMRYSGASIGYQLASIIAGGPAPIVAAWLLAQYKSGTVIAVYIAICAVIAFIATLFMTEYSNREIHEEYEHVKPTPTPPDSYTRIQRDTGIDYPA